MSYENFKRGEPNGEVEENCIATIKDKAYVWYDMPCHKTRPFICEIDTE